MYFLLSSEMVKMIVSKWLVSAMNAIARWIWNGGSMFLLCEQYQKQMPFCVQCEALIGNRRYVEL